MFCDKGMATFFSILFWSITRTRVCHYDVSCKARSIYTCNEATSNICTECNIALNFTHKYKLKSLDHYNPMLNTDTDNYSCYDMWL